MRSPRTFDFANGCSIPDSMFAQGGAVADDAIFIENATHRNSMPARSTTMKGTDLCIWYSRITVDIE